MSAPEAPRGGGGGPVPGDDGRVTLFLCGDVMTGRGVDQILPHPSRPELYEPFAGSAGSYVELAERANGPVPRGVAPDYPWGVLPEVLARERPHRRIVNLETSVTTAEDAEPKGINYRMHPDNVGVLEAAGIDCCVLANNHVLDWGTAGLLETVATLDGAGIPVAGAGATLADAARPAVLPVPGGRVLVVAFGLPDAGIPPHWAAEELRPGVHLLPDLSARSVARVARLVEAARRPGDLVVASVHWGSNWGYRVPGAHRRFAHALVEEAGVHVVHGHSSHHPKAIEVHRGRPILYGCGDFLNDYEGIAGHEEYRGDLVLGYFPTLDGRTGELLRLVLAPFQLHRFRLRPPAPADRAWLRERLDHECRRFGARVVACGDALALERE